MYSSLMPITVWGSQSLSMARGYFYAWCDPPINECPHFLGQASLMLLCNSWTQSSLVSFRGRSLKSITCVRRVGITVLTALHTSSGGRTRKVWFRKRKVMNSDSYFQVKWVATMFWLGFYSYILLCLWLKIFVSIDTNMGIILWYVS